MKVLSCVGKQSQDGTKTFYNTAVEKDGNQIEATAFEQLQVGETIDDSRLARNKNDTGWIIKSVSKGGGKGNYQRNDSAIRAQVAFKGMVDLIIANKMNVADLNSETCIKFAQIIKRTEAAVGDAAPKPDLAGQPPSPHGADPTKVPLPPRPDTDTGAPPIKNMGDLRMRIKKAYPDLKVAAQDAILGKDVTDYDAAFKKVADAMEGDIKW